MRWYVRSAGHTDAHYGALAMDGTVLAVCGLSFRPQPHMFGDGPAVLAPPVDPVRCCPQCVAAGQDTRHAEEGAAVAELIHTLGGGDLQ
ncbi:MAG: hypothetical protein JO287_16210 [Pseudonocardiales bacterium]|nr:hypothetical protein [Pseudonocardiales bacterium]